MLLVKLVVPMANKSTRVDMSEVFAGFDKLLEIKEGVARAMGVAMGQEVRDEAKLRAPVLEPGNEGVDNQRPGVLRDAIYVAYDDRRRILNPNAFRYTVSWNAKKAPHGHLAEFGHWMPYEYALTAEGLFYTPIPNNTGRGKQKGIPLEGDGFWVSAQPFLGPAFDAKLPRLASVAIQAGRIKFSEVT